MLKEQLLKKEYGLSAGAVLLLLLCYQLAFKKTIEAYSVNRDLKSKIEQSSGLDYQPEYMARKNKNLDRILERYHMDSLALRGNAVANLSVIANKSGVKLTELPNQDPSFNTAHFILQRVDFEGDYFSLLKLLNNFQNASGVGMPRSVVWKSVIKNPGQGDARKLQLEVYFEIGK